MLTLSPIAARGLPLAILIAVDLITKGLAAAFLPEGAPVDDQAALQLVLRYNELGLGTWARALDSPERDRIVGSLGFLLVSLSLFYFQRKAWSVSRRVVCGLFAFLLGYVIGKLVIPPLGQLPTPLFIALARTGPASFFVCLWWLSSPGASRVTATLFAATALGNLLCLAIPPHLIVDFLYSKLIALAFRQGVVNIADLYFDAAIVCLAFMVGRSLIRRLTRRSSAA